MKNAKSKSFGFTLLELMVAMTIVAIVSAIALPLYTQFTDRSYRTEAQADMLACTQALERWSAVNFTYLGAADEDADEASDGVASASDTGRLGLDVCRPNSFQQNRYDVTIAATATTYVLTGAPIADGPMDGDGDLAIDDAGNRSWDEDDDGVIEVDEDDWEED
ncbi:MAG: prepilin-type N-terminal cleavage/methylation domain-containing protein [Pseudomonadales bacterium]|nr:prepilin-type N-terminal cleavage/methylation domain-containing protein [Pseudomonadales bacterium]